MIARSDELNELATALSAAQAEFSAIPKDSENPFFKSKYAGLSQVIKTASPIVTKHGLAVTQFIGCDETGDTLTTWLLHKSGQFIAQSMHLHLGKNNDAQAQGSATTYAKRYSYMAVLGLVADEDDDGHKASQRQQKATTNGSALVDKAAIAELQAAAKGLQADQIKLAFTACGIHIPDPLVWNVVPQAKAAAMCEALAGVPR